MGEVGASAPSISTTCGQRVLKGEGNVTQPSEKKEEEEEGNQGSKRGNVYLKTEI